MHDKLLETDAQVFRAHFEHEPFLVRHHLADHPLFALERLLELAKNLPEANVEYNPGSLPISMDPKLTPRNGLTVAQTVARIEECSSWMVLKNVEDDPDYAALLAACLDEIRVHTDPIVAGMHTKVGFIFLSSPGSTTPYHMDAEHNFLLQVRGRKAVHIFEPSDRSLMSDREIEAYFGGGHRNMVYKEAYEEKARVFELTPGLGLHFPPLAPHWVKNGDAVSISFSITFQSPRLEARTRVYKMNARLRKWGWNPSPYGRSALRDAAKSHGLRLFTSAKRLLSRARGVDGRP